ncbi:hypothetical protein ACH41C_20955 [Streptomyces althioticus]|uniref:hypothetical protein n=1 Tax=Streptomyces althioticus TaxID=83380 RepID=UPI0033FF7DD6
MSQPGGVRPGLTPDPPLTRRRRRQCARAPGTVTQADLDQGFAPQVTVVGTAPDGTQVSSTVTGDRARIH